MTDLVAGFLLVGPKTGPDVGKASPVGLFIVVLLLIVVFILVWSMNRHLKKIPANFDTPESVPGDAATPDAAAPDAPTPDAATPEPAAREEDGPEPDETERPARESGG